jgi:uncharacterized protein YbaP (TraB family)
MRTAQGAWQRVSAIRAVYAIGALALLVGCDQLTAAKGVSWTLERDDHQIVVVPTFHMSTSYVRRLSRDLTKQVTEADYLYTELDLTSVTLKDEFAACQRVTPSIEQPTASREAIELVSRSLPQVAGAAKPDGIHYARLMQLVLDHAYAETGASGKNGIDLQLLELARSRGVKVRALETPCEQLAHAASVRDIATKQHVEEAIRFNTSGAAGSFLRAVHSGWNDGNWTTMKSAVADLESTFPMTTRFGHAAIIQQRNAIMAERVVARSLESRRIVVAVGFLHLLGPASVVDQLRGRGYRVVNGPVESLAATDAGATQPGGRK